MASSFRGTIAFGAIMVPIRAYKATREDKVSFNQVHAADMGQVRYKKICSGCGEELKSAADICKGYKTNVAVEDPVTKEIKIETRMLSFTDDDIERLRPAANKNIEIDTFCRMEDVPFVALGQSYYIGTEEAKKGGLGRPFALLRDAMRAAGKVAIVKWTTRGSEHLGMLQADGNGFLLKTLEFASAVRQNDAEVIEAEVPAEMVQKAVQIINGKMSKPFDYEGIKSTYNDALRDLIERMAAGEEIKVEEVAPKVTDNLDDALEAMA